MSQQNINTTASEAEKSSGESPIRAHLVPACLSLSFYDGFFGYQGQKAQIYLSHWMQSHCQNYPDGYWEYFFTDNGTCFVVPGFEDRKNIQNLFRGFSGEMLAVAAGITATLFVLKCLAWQAWSKNGNDLLISKLNRYADTLCDYVLTLEESSVIFRAIG